MLVKTRIEQLCTPFFAASLCFCHRFNMCFAQRCQDAKHSSQLEQTCALFGLYVSHPTICKVCFRSHEPVFESCDPQNIMSCGSEEDSCLANSYIYPCFRSTAYLQTCSQKLQQNLVFTMSEVQLCQKNLA